MEKKKLTNEKEQAEFERKKSEVYNDLSETVSKGLAHVCLLKKIADIVKVLFQRQDTKPV